MIETRNEAADMNVACYLLTLDNATDAWLVRQTIKSNPRGEDAEAKL